MTEQSSTVLSNIIQILTDVSTESGLSFQSCTQTFLAAYQCHLEGGSQEAVQKTIADGVVAGRAKPL